MADEIQTMIDSKLICNVCDKNEALGVASSTLAAMSFAYCRECLEHNADVYGLIQFSFEECEGHVADWVLELSIYRDGTYTKIRDLPDGWWKDDEGESG